MALPIVVPILLNAMVIPSRACAGAIWFVPHEGGMRRGVSSPDLPPGKF
jgi:hypothetical protein